MDYDEVLENLDKIEDRPNNLVDLYNFLLNEGIYVGEGQGEFIEDMSELRYYFEGKNFDKIIKTLYYSIRDKAFFPDDDYFWFDIYGRIQTASDIKDFPFTLEDLAQAIIENDVEDYVDYL